MQTGAGYVARPPAQKLFNPRAWLRHTPYTRFEISYFCIRFSLISPSKNTAPYRNGLCFGLHQSWTRLFFFFGVVQRIDAVAAVDISDFAGDARGEIREQEGGGVAHFFDGYVAAERVVRSHMAQELAEVGNARSGQGFDGACGSAVAADALFG